MTDWINRFDQIKNKVKFQLNAKGVDNINQLRGLFQEFDRDNSGTLSKLEFEEFISKLGVFLKKQELTTVYNNFDNNRDGQIQYEEFMNTLRTDMVDRRIAVVKHAWQIISRGAPSVGFDVLQNAYNANVHPRVRTREKLVETVRSDFVQLMGERAPNGQVSEQAFIQYYADINACLPAEKDDYFTDLLL